MDVTCERCDTEYEFDETLLSGRGTSVKCTNCGHVFKVYATARADEDRSASTWRLRLEGGSIDTIDSLRELQRRIGSGELTPEDQIARGEEEWKTLGSIPELETFFQAGGVQAPAGRVVSPIPPSSAPPDETSSDSSLPPGRRPRQPTLLGVRPVEKVILGTGSESGAASETGGETVLDTEPEPVAGGSETAYVAEPAYRSPYASSTGPVAAISSSPLAEIEDAEFEETPPGLGTSSVRTSTPPPAYYDDDDIPELPGRRGSPLRWLLMIVIVGGLALMLTQWERVARLLGVGSDPAVVAAEIAEGDAGIAQGHPQAYASAIEAYGRAIEAGGDRDPEILAKLSNAYALAAQAQLDDGASGESVESLTAAALTTALDALNIDSLELEARLAEADALRLVGEMAQARTALEDARSTSFSRTAEFYRIDARLSAAEAGGGLQGGLRSAKQAAELAPHDVRYLLLLARAEHASGDDAGARSALETILLDHPEHPVATKLLAKLEEAEAVAAVAADAGVAPDAGGETDTGTVAGSAAEAAAEPAPPEAPEPAVEKMAPKTVDRPRKRRSPPKPTYDEYDQLVKAAGDDAFVDGRPPVRDYEWYMRQGRAELAGGKYSRARAFFDSALEAQPGSADAMDGLGQISTRIEDYNSALRYFRVAAQRGHPDGYFNLGQTYERLGRNEEAVSAYYTYVKRRPSGTHAASAKSAIKTLEPLAKLPSEPESEPEPEPEPSVESEPSPTEEPTQESEPAAP
jgi:predicted Zn finger-like uncharacterized protein